MPRLIPCADPAPTVTVAECADSSVNLVFSIWTQDESLEGQLKSEYLEKAKNALDAAGISIPFPHVQLLLEGARASDAAAKATVPPPAIAA